MRHNDDGMRHNDDGKLHCISQDNEFHNCYTTSSDTYVDQIVWFMKYQYDELYGPLNHILITLAILIQINRISKCGRQEHIS